MTYQLLDSGAGEKLEQWGPYTLVRPDPQILWQKHLPETAWAAADALFRDDGWIKNNPAMPATWPLEMANLQVECRLTPFKHTGVFPEQSGQWAWLKQQCLDAGEGCSVLNLFGYTGIASLVCAQAGAKVTHVDASRPAIGWARRNQELSALTDKPIRWMLDDVIKFVQKEGRRGNKYQGIMMDPPVYGHGPEGQAWQFNKSLPLLIEALKPLLADNLKFVLINSYAVTTSHITLANVLTDLTTEKKGRVESGELLLEQQDASRKLSTGIWAKWESE